MNDDVRSPGSGSTPGPLSAAPPPGLGETDPGKFAQFLYLVIIIISRYHTLYASGSGTK